MKVKFEKIRRISGLCHYINNGINVSKINMNGFIKLTKEDEITKFSGIALDIEGNDKYVMDNISDNIMDAHYIRGIIEDKSLKLTVLSNKNRPIDYKLMRVSLSDYYGCSFEVDFKTNYEQVDKMILSYNEAIKDYNKVTITDLDINTNQDYIATKLGDSMYKLHKVRLPINIFLNNLMKKEQSYTVGEAFESKAIKLSKTLLNKRV